MAGAFVYLVCCRDGSLYCGWTTDPAQREAAHNAGRGAAYTRSRRPVRLVYLEVMADRSTALQREYAIKCLSRSDKLRLIASATGVARRRLARVRRVMGARPARS